MRKFLLILALFSSSASAQWQNLGGNDEETAYADTSGIQHRDRHRVKMWALFDLKSPRSFGDLSYASMKIQREYNCDSKESRIVAMSAHSGNMGTGETVYSNNTHYKWSGVKPDSAEQALWNLACTPPE